MSNRHYEVDPRILTVFFFVAIPFLAFGALVVMNLARGHLQNVTGQNLEQRAGETFDGAQRRAQSVPRRSARGGHGC